MVSRLFFILAATLLTVGAVAAPATQPLTPEAEKQKDELDSTVEASKLPAIRVDSLTGVVRFSITADMLAVEQTLPTVKAGEYHVLLPSPHVIATIRELGRIRNQAVDGTPPRYFFFISRDFSQPGPSEPQTTVSAAVGNLQIVREFEYDTPAGHFSGNVTLIQDPPPAGGEASGPEDPVRLTIQKQSDPPQIGDVNLKFSAPTFVELRRRYPRELDQYLRPILRDFGQESTVLSPDIASAWQVLAADWTPEPATVQQVKSLVQQTNADAFSDRRAALQSLHNLGEQGALVLMRMDRAGWSAEQGSAIDTLLTPYLPLSAQDVAKMGNDASFLLNLQYIDDATVRSLAAARLTKVIGHAISFDPKAENAVRLPAVEQMRSALNATSQPTSDADGPLPRLPVSGSVR